MPDRLNFSLLSLLLVAATAQGGWNVAPPSALALDPAGIANIDGMSGVVYLGPTLTGRHEFAAVQDSGNQLTRFEIELASDGSLLSAAATASLSLAPGFDFEGLAVDPTSGDWLVSEETTPTVRRYDSGGAQVATASLPAVFASARSNLGFESLTHVPGTDLLWTANEQALTIDGPIANLNAGTTVRLLSLDADTLDGSGPQYAYGVDSIHYGSTSGSPARSGLVDLVGLPDGTLLALERSLGVQSPLAQFESRIYEIDFQGATDVSGGAFDAGLDGATYTPVGKSLLWSGQAGGFLGQNLEGLALGPRLDDGSWVLVGVVDSGGSADPLSGNTVVSFRLSLDGCSVAGDYNCDGAVNQSDYALWANTFGDHVPSTSDGNGSGAVDLADYTVWRDHLGATAMASANGRVTPVPEPAIGWPMLALAGSFIHRRRKRVSTAASSSARRRMVRS